MCFFGLLLDVCLFMGHLWDMIFVGAALRPQLPYPTEGVKALLLRSAASRLVLFTSGGGFVAIRNWMMLGLQWLASSTVGIKRITVKRSGCNWNQKPWISYDFMGGPFSRFFFFKKSPWQVTWLSTKGHARPS